MYFGNISDRELSQYHNKVYTNFSMGLITVLSSPLFKIEEIVPNNIYKIYPLFYCENISSTNSADKIIENKCIICIKNTNTLLHFKTERNYVVSSLNCSWLADENGGIFLGTVFDEKGNAINGAEVTFEYTHYRQSKKFIETGVTGFDGLFYFGVGRLLGSIKGIIRYNDLELVLNG